MEDFLFIDQNTSQIPTCFIDPVYYLSMDTAHANNILPRTRQKSQIQPKTQTDKTTLKASQCLTSRHIDRATSSKDSIKTEQQKQAHGTEC